MQRVLGRAVVSIWKAWYAEKSFKRFGIAGSKLQWKKWWWFTARSPTRDHVPATGKNLYKLQDGFQKARSVFAVRGKSVEAVFCSSLIFEAKPGCLKAAATRPLCDTLQATILCLCKIAFFYIPSFVEQKLTYCLLLPYYKCCVASGLMKIVRGWVNAGSIGRQEALLKKSCTMTFFSVVENQFYRIVSKQRLLAKSVKYWHAILRYTTAQTVQRRGIVKRYLISFYFLLCLTACLNC